MRTKILLVVLAGGLLLSLTANIIVIRNLLLFKAGALETVIAARAFIDNLDEEPFNTVVMIDQVLPLRVDIPIDQTITIPLDYTHSIDTVVNMQVMLPMMGLQMVAVPVKGDIPIGTTVEIPVRMTVPVSTEYHIEMEMPVQVMLPESTMKKLKQTLDQIETGLR